MCGDMQECYIEPGSPFPLGLSYKNNSYNFAIFYPSSSPPILKIYSPDTNSLQKTFTLSHRTGEIWHICLHNLPSSFDWGWSIKGKENQLFLDPYAKQLNSSFTWGEQKSSTPLLGRWPETEQPFDWEAVEPPSHPAEQLVIYEMHVRAFTMHPSSQVKYPGTFLGLIEKIPYLKSLGINAIELLPIFEFNENENMHMCPETKKRLYNFWGYSTVNFFSLMRRYSVKDPIFEFKTLVKELHKAGIEIFLDVVYNHTSEGGSQGIEQSFKAFSSDTYYLKNNKGDYLNFSGCGNCLNANHPVVASYILDSLRYWALEMRVDGFRFDLASILTRDSSGTPLKHPLVVEMMSKDPWLKDKKLIAEAWDAAGLYQIGLFPSFGRWSEWNGKFRDSVRRFIKGSDGQAPDFSKALCGSENIYGAYRSPLHSLNFIISHDGFTLRDLVSYNNKHNLSNGENNQDGMNNNDSWNCGAEGESTQPKILQLRDRQMHNFHSALMLSLGVVMVWMGDEYGHTRKGNNNAWCHDTEINWFCWDQLEHSTKWHRFYKLMIEMRHKEPLLHRKTFLTPSDVDWHGHQPFHPDWSSRSKFVAYTLKDSFHQNPLYIAFNAENARVTITLPPPPKFKKWHRIVDTAFASPGDFIENPFETTPSIKATYKMEAYSVLIAKAL